MLGEHTLTQDFTAPGTSSSKVMTGRFNVSISGFGSATVLLQRSFDGTNWKTVDTFTADEEGQINEPEDGVYWRWNCTVHGSGTIACRLSQTYPGAR